MAESPVLATIAQCEAQGLDAIATDRIVWERHGLTCAMVAVDSSGMTRVTREQGIIRFLAAYARMRALAARLLAGHRCRAWRSHADNLFAEFATPAAALEFALALHRELRVAAIPLTAAGETYRVCVAIGWGRVLDDGPNGVMGDEMNLAAKLAEDVAGPAQTLLTTAAHGGLVGVGAVEFENRSQMIGGLPVAYVAVRGLS